MLSDGHSSPCWPGWWGRVGSGPGCGGPFPKACVCFAVVGGSSKSLLVSCGWSLTKPCPQLLAHGVLGCHHRLVTLMSVWSCRKNVSLFCSFCKKIQNLQKNPELDSAKVQNNVNHGSSVSVKERIKSGSWTISSGYIGGLWTRNYEVSNSWELLKPTEEN